MTKKAIITAVVTLLTWPSISLAQTNNSQEIVSSYFEKVFKQGDFDGVRKLVGAGAEYQQAVGLPYGGTYKGYDEWLAMFSKVQVHFDLHFEDDLVLFVSADGKGVIGSFTVTLKSRKTGRSIRMPVLERFEIQNGLIASVKPYYFDTASTVALLKE